MSHGNASRVTSNTLASDRTIQSGESITVYGFTVANSHTSAIKVVIQDSDGNTEWVVVTPAQGTTVVDVEWLADNGVVFSAPAANGDQVDFTIAHSSGGA